MRKNILIAIIAATMGLQNFVSAGAQQIASASKDKNPFSLQVSQTYSSRKYILGPNDVIDISIFDSPEYDVKNLRVQPDGRIAVPSVGILNVNGMTVEDLQSELIQRYKKYLNEPQVAINLDKPKSFIVYVAGAVMNPGSYELETDGTGNSYNNKPETLIERKTPLLSNILVASGGVAFDADLEHIQVKNKFDNSKFEINIFDLLDNTGSDGDIYLMPGDNVYVPKLATPLAVSDDTYKKYASATFSPKTVYVKVYGYVNQPGLVKLDPSQNLNLNSAITSAGGYLRDSAYAPKKVFLSRADNNGKLVTTTINPSENDTMLRPNDIIYIPEKTRPMIGKAFDYATRILAPAASAANTYNGWSQMFDPKRFIAP